MTSVVRLYVVAAAILVLFVAWAFAAAHPWGDPAVDPRAQALAVREQRVRRESIQVQQLVDRRWEIYRAQLADRRLAIGAISRRAAAARAAAAAAPIVRLAPLPPVTVTRSS